MDAKVEVHRRVRTSTRPQYQARFDRLFDKGRSAVLSHAHFIDVPPVEGGRWGLSCAVVPEGVIAQRLAELSAEMAAVAGGRQWPTGATEAVHFTVRAIEVHREGLSPVDPLVRRCASAVERAAAQSERIGLRLVGLTLTPTGVMVCAFPVDDAADAFADRLGEELGHDGSFEATYERDIWYATLLHFADHVSDPAGLIDWVAARRRLRLGVAEMDAAQLLTFRYNGRQPVRESLGRGAFGGVRWGDAIENRVGDRIAPLHR